MTESGILNHLRDLRHFRLFPKRYKTSKGRSRAYWSKVSRAYGNFTKRVASSDYHWYVITYKDGREELAYFRMWYIVIPHKGRLCRGIIPHYWSVMQFEHTKDIRLAF